jgi:hypothetical protein
LPPGQSHKNGELVKRAKRSGENTKSLSRRQRQTVFVTVLVKGAKKAQQTRA